MLSFKTKSSRNASLMLLVLCCLVQMSCVPPSEDVYTVGSSSMRPTLNEGDRISVRNYVGRRPERWDIVVFHAPVDTNWVFVSRVVGLPCEELQLDIGGVDVNGKFLWPPSASGLAYDKHLHGPHAIMDPYRVPSNAVFVVGDNSFARDSRYWGALPLRLLIGKVVDVKHK